MEELSSADVQVVLTIKEGKGFEQVSQATSVVATLNGHALETDVIEPCPNPQYATDLIWEIDKNRLRKMRSGQVPLKLECFAVKGNDSKEKLGYLLLGLRSAQIVPKNSNVYVKSLWHKLLGVKHELKQQKPELLLSLTIHEQESVIPNAPLELNNSEKCYQATSENDNLSPILLHDQRLIQLGPLTTCHDLFLMSVTAVSATNIDSLLAKESCTDAEVNLNFMFQIFGNDIYFKPFKKDKGEVSLLNEKIVIRVRTSLKVLKEYLKVNSLLFINLKHKENVIAHSDMNLGPLVPTDSLQEFLRISQGGSSIIKDRCFLHKSDITESSEKAYLDIQLKLQYVGVKPDVTAEVPTTALNNNAALVTITNTGKDEKNNLLQLTPSEIDSHRNPGGDVGKCMSEIPYSLNYPNECHIRNKCSSSCEGLKKEPIRAICSQSADTVLCQCSNKDCSKSVEAYHCYCLNILITAIQLTLPNLIGSHVEIRFHHPKTELISTHCPKIPISSGEKVKLQNAKCNLHFISAADEIKHLLVSYPPRISIFSTVEPRICISELQLSLKELLCQNKSNCQYERILHDTEQNKIGSLDITLTLEDHGPYYRIKRRASNESLGPPILDDSLAYKIVDELETWKERQKEIFKVELKRKEERHLNLLSEEWQKHREDLELKLACSVEQCKMLANSLNNATEDLRVRRLKSLEKETRLIKANEDLQWRYDVKIQELKDSFRAMQEELTIKINVLEKRKVTLEGQVEPLTIENERLRLIVAKQSEELENYQKGSLTQDQTANLLQELKTLEEKLHNAQESKSFFKEQWAKAVREIHRMKMEHQQAIQVQIKTSKEELQDIDLEEILCADSTALTNDQILLGQIQKEIDVIKPKPSLIESDPRTQVFTPTASIVCTVPQTSSKTTKKWDEYDERLQALIEERDSLLKTGSYTIDDALIVKLNNEIRSLMMR